MKIDDHKMLIEMFKKAKKFEAVKKELMDFIGFYERNCRTTPFHSYFSLKFEWSKKLLEILGDKE